MLCLLARSAIKQDPQYIFKRTSDFKVEAESVS